MSTRIELSAGFIEVRCELDLVTVSQEDLAYIAGLAQLLQSRPSPDSDGSQPADVPEPQESGSLTPRAESAE